jgi:hypothetical protein
MTVNALPTPTLASDDSDSRVCSGNIVTFTATGADQYIFLVDGVEAQAQSAAATYAHTATNNGEFISVIGVNTTTTCQAVSTTIVTLNVDDCYDYSGILAYANTAETPMGNVTITLTGSNDTKTVTTDVTDGTFTLTDLFDQQDYAVSYNTGKTHGGINSTDALIIFLRSLSILTYNTASVQGIASDVNNASSITVLDALQVQLRFTTAINSFAAGDWAFETGILSVSGSNTTGQTLYALAMGDANGSYTPNIAENAKVMLQNNGSLTVNDGDRVMIPVRMEQREILGAISMVMNIPSSTMTIHNVQLANNNAIQYQINGDELRMAWYSSNSLDLSTGDVLFYIDATINDAFQFVANPIVLNNQCELADEIADVINNVNVSIPTMNTLSTSLTTINGEVIGIRNFPSPFTSMTTIEYTLPTAAEVSITTYNSLGQPINQIVNANHTAGTHQVIWNASDLPSGMYFYTIIINDGHETYTATKSVLLNR